MRNCEVDFINVREENVKEIKDNEVVAFTFAYGGAMGEPGNLTIISKSDKVKVYKTNWIEEDIVEQISFFKPFMEDLVKSEYWLMNEQEGWDKFELGMGNYLFIKSQYLSDFEKFAKEEYKNTRKMFGALCYKIIPLLKWFFEEIQ